MPNIGRNGGTQTGEKIGKVKEIVAEIPSKCQQGQGWWWRESRARCRKRWRTHILVHQVQQNISMLKSPCQWSEAMKTNRKPTFFFLMIEDIDWNYSFFHQVNMFFLQLSSFFLSLVFPLQKNRKRERERDQTKLREDEIWRTKMSILSWWGFNLKRKENHSRWAFFAICNTSFGIRIYTPDVLSLAILNAFYKMQKL